jgi:hypothetical protein
MRNRCVQNLLRLIGVGEFASEANFVNPCKSYILPDVICSFCSSISSMDLLRDAQIMQGDWKCHNCGNKYNKSLIEKMLVDIVQHESLAYQKQDLVCTKCAFVKAENMATICSRCSGTFQSRQTPSILRERYEIVSCDSYKLSLSLTRATLTHMLQCCDRDCNVCHSCSVFRCSAKLLKCIRSNGLKR